MNIGYIALISVTFAILFVVIQRTEKTKRRISWGLLVLGVILVRHVALVKNDLHLESLLGFIIGAILSFLFWMLIGQYNPVGSSDAIHVIGMDD